MSKDLLQNKIADIILEEIGNNAIGHRHSLARRILEECGGLAAYRLGYAAGKYAGTDDPEMDGTDFAHPAYLRGEEHAAKIICKMVNDILDGTESKAGIVSNPWQLLRQRLYDIRTLLGIAERVVDAAGFIGITKLSVMQWYKVRNDYAKRLKEKPSDLRTPKSK